MPQEFSITPRFIANVRRRDFSFVPSHTPPIGENTRRNNTDIGVLMILSEEVPLTIEEVQEEFFNEFPNVVKDLDITTGDIRNSVRRLFEGDFLVVQEA